MLRKLMTDTAMISSIRVFRLLIQFITIPILARLLTPEEFGVVAIAMPFILIAMMLADAGIGMSLVRTDLAERHIWSSCFWVACLMGCAFALIMIVLAPLAAHFFATPELSPILIVLSFVVLAQAIHLIPTAALQRSSAFSTIALIEFSSTIVGILSAVVLAYADFGAWALVGQQVGFFAVRVVMTCWLSPFRPQWIFNLKEIREHLVFGRNILSTNLVNHASRSLDPWIVGKALDTIALGYYTMAFQFARLPVMIISGPLQMVTYATLAKMKDKAEAIGHLYLPITQLLLACVIPPIAMIAVTHTPVFEVFLSARWHMSGVLFMILAPAVIIQSASAIGESVLYALGKSHVQFRNATEFCILWIGALLVVVSGGLVYAAIAYSVCCLLYHPRFLMRLLPLIGLSWRDYLSAYLRPVAASMVAIILYEIIDTSVTPSIHAQIALSASLALLAMLASVLPQWHRIRQTFQDYLPER